ncbi:MAG: leucine-rich repeat domain-containing protein [Bacteroidales bacterium]|nr:leucine-rich repeat domain-containing protein [Bacteroidales bacterium]
MKKIIRNFIVLLCAIVFCANAFAYNFTVDGIYYNINADNVSVSVTYKTTNYNTYSGDVVIPSNVTYNGVNYAVTKIGDEAFRYCRNLTSVVIPNSITYIGAASFIGCKSLTSILIPNSVTYIGHSSFGRCEVLDSVIVPNSVTSIGEKAFYECLSLTYISLPNSLTYLSEGMFKGCTSLVSIILPNSIMIMEGHIFESCTNLNSVTIPEGVTSLGEWTFWNCSGLSSITIPMNVESIGDYSFSNCTSLNTIRCKGLEPPTLLSTVFTNVNKNNITLIVPCGKQSAYQQAVVWGLFNHIEEDCVGLNDVEKDNTISLYPNPAKESVSLNAEGDVIIYNNLGQTVKQVNNVKGNTTISVADLPKGTYYLKVGEKKQKLIIIRN